LSHYWLNIANSTTYFGDQLLRQLNLGELAKPVHVGGVAHVVLSSTRQCIGSFSPKFPCCVDGLGC